MRDSETRTQKLNNSNDEKRIKETIAVVTKDLKQRGIYNAPQDSLIARYAFLTVEIEKLEKQLSGNYVVLVAGKNVPNPKFVAYERIADMIIKLARSLGLNVSHEERGKRGKGLLTFNDTEGETNEN